MKLICTYKSNHRYGQADASLDYAASVQSTPHSGDIAIRYKFQVCPPAISESANAAAQVSEVLLRLTKAEALKLASSILAHVHHPNSSGCPIHWMPIESMPELRKSLWKEKIEIRHNVWIDRTTKVGRRTEIRTPLPNTLYIHNKSLHYIGRIEFAVFYEVTACDNNTGPRTTSWILDVDLPPGTTKVFDFENEYLPYYEHDERVSGTEFTIEKVFGVTPKKAQSHTD